MVKSEVIVLRLGHRPERDKRLTTHVFLTARALSASNGMYTGTIDHKLKNTIQNITSKWGGTFSIKHQKNYIDIINKYKKRDFTIIHLTMYGLPIQDKIKEIKDNNKIIIIVGGRKVPPEIYNIADYNISITSQPHSEVAALAIFLHKYQEGKELDQEFKNPKLKIKPQEHGKKVLDNSS